MSNKNRRRSHTSGQNIRTLEGGLSLKERLFSILALRRGWRRLKRWVLILILSLAITAGAGYAIMLAVEKAYSLSIDHISYESRHKLISKSQAMQLLGLKDSVNMATLDAAGMENTLLKHPCIEAAHIRAELPETLFIEVTERIPIAYVEMESGADTGNRQRLFMDPQGVLFPIREEYHRDFMGVPVWYLQADDVERFEAGAVIGEKQRRPIVELVAAANLYSLIEIPAIQEIFRPKEWKIIITLENGTEVLMQVYDIKGQMERLAMLLEHTRATHRKARSINVIPKINPTVVYQEEKESKSSSKKSNKD